VRSKHCKYGYQPIQDIILNDGRTLRGFVRSRLTTGNQSHALLAIAGRVAPSPELRAELPAVLGLPLEVLFTKAALDAEYAFRGERRKMPI